MEEVKPKPRLWCGRCHKQIKTGTMSRHWQVDHPKAFKEKSNGQQY